MASVTVAATNAAPGDALADGVDDADTESAWDGSGVDTTESDWDGDGDGVDDTDSESDGDGVAVAVANTES